MVPGGLCFHPSHCLLRHRFAVGERGCGHPGEQQGRTGGWWPCPFWMRNGIWQCITYISKTSIYQLESSSPKKTCFSVCRPSCCFIDPSERNQLRWLWGTNLYKWKCNHVHFDGCLCLFCGNFVPTWCFDIFGIMYDLMGRVTKPGERMDMARVQSQVIQSAMFVSIGHKNFCNLSDGFLSPLEAFSLMSCGTEIFHTLPGRDPSALPPKNRSGPGQGVHCVVVLAPGAGGLVPPRHYPSQPALGPWAFAVQRVHREWTSGAWCLGASTFSNR